MRRWVVLGMFVAVAAIFAIPAQAATTTVNVVFPTFSPATANIHVGDSVVWHSTETAGGPNHTATGDNGEFNTGNIGPQGTSAPVIFNSAGTFTYHCSIHTQMTGSVFVQGATTTSESTTSTSRPAATTTTAKGTTTSSSLKPTTTSSSSSTSSTTETTEPDTATTEESTTTSTTDLVAAPTTHKGGGAGAAAALIVLILAVAAAGGFAVYRLRANR